MNRQSLDWRQVPLGLTAAIREGVEELATKEGARSADVLAATLLAVLGRYMRSDKVSVEVTTPTDRRSVRVTLAPQVTFRDLVRRVRAAEHEQEHERSNDGRVDVRACAVATRPPVPDTADRLAEHCRVLLEAALRAPDLAVARLPLLGAGERHQVIVEWNRTDAPFPIDRLVHQLFEAQVDRAPDAVAVVQGDVTLTYAELEAQANALARELQARGVVPGVRVAICLQRSPRLVSALLAVLKAGGAYVPLDPAHPPARLQLMVGDSQAKVVVVEEATRAWCSSAAELVDLDRLVGDEVATRPPCTATIDDVAYLIYTSGSTGTPKGVVVRHRPVLNVLDWVNRTFDLSRSDRLLFVTSPCFDLSVYDVFGALAAGASIQVASREELGDPRRLVELLDGGTITVWDSAPAAIAQLEPWMPAGSRSSRLRLVLLSGDWIPVTLPDRIRAAWPGARVVSLGGATEATIWSNWYPIDAVDPSWPSIPYGRPIQNARYYVLDGAMQPVPIGVPGDLWIGGACLADGYHGRCELTAERFVADPFTPGGRLYRTGDLARFFPDGDLQFLGRVDHQVKVRGYRIELGEVEAALAQVVGVAACVVAARGEPGQDRTLVGYVVPGEPAPSVDALRRALRDRLPEHMVPSHFVTLPALPLNPNGKVDRAALPPPTAPTPSAAPAPPRDELERLVASLWQELLKVDAVGLDDDFFALGGHSLLALRFVARLEETLGHSPALADLLTAPTLRAFAEVVRRRGGHRGLLIPLARGGDGAPVFVLPGIGGHAITFRALAQQLGDERPVLGLQAIGIDGAEPPLARLELIASRYVDELARAAPRGPFVLLGYSVGAMVAFEVARRFVHPHAYVKQVVIVDCHAPGYPPALPLRARLQAHARQLLERSWKDRLAYLRGKTDRRRWQLLRSVGVFPPSRALPSCEVAARVEAVRRGLLHARNRYWPESRLCVPVLVLRAADPGPLNPFANDDDPLLGWSRFLDGPVSSAEVPGRHATLFEPGNVASLAATVRRYLSEAEVDAPHRRVA